MDNLILSLMFYISTVSGNFSPELGYDSQLKIDPRMGIPTVQLMSAERLFMMKFGRPQTENEVFKIEGLYFFGGKIYLNNQWDINDPVDQSKLLHELVHFLQDSNMLFYRCSGERERLAYMIQKQWLHEQHGIDMNEALNLHPLAEYALTASCPPPETFAKPGEGGI